MYSSIDWRARRICHFRQKMATVFKQQNEGESLDHFAERQVTTTHLERTRFSEDIDGFVRCLHSQAFSVPYSVKEVVKSGSLGKGTAVRDLADIDLVVFVNGLTSIEDLKTNRQHLLQELENNVEKILKIKPVKRTKYSLSFDWNGHKADILPAFDLLSHYEGSPASIYYAMQQFGSGTEAGQEFAASLAPLQLEFVKNVPEHIKRVIRLVKLWKEENSLKIRSYSLELVTIFAWRLSLRGHPGTDFLFQKVMEHLSCCNTLQVAFVDNYISSAFNSLSPPYILDPANPYMNTLHGASIAAISDCAQRTLETIRH